MGVELNNQNNNEDNIKQPLLQTQQTIQQPQQQQPIYTTAGIVTPQPIIMPGGQPYLSLPMAKYKVRPELNCAGNFRQYKTSFPVELLGTFTNQEYECIINDINKIVNFNKKPVLFAIIFQLLFIVPIVIFASIGNLALLYTSLGCNIVAAFIVIGVSIGLPKRMVKKLEHHIACLNNNYASKNVRFEICPKFFSSAGKKFRVKLYIRYPPVVLAPLSSVQPPQMYYNAPPQQPSSSSQQYSTNYSPVPVYTSQQPQQYYQQPPPPQQYYQQPPSYLNNVDNNNNSNNNN